MAVQSRPTSAGVVRRLATALLAVLACQTPGRADDFTWTAVAGGNYNLGTNWSGGVIPAAADNVFFDALAGSYVVNLIDDRTINNVTVSTGQATLNHTGGTYTVNGAFALNAGTYTLSGGSLNVVGTMTTAAGANFNWSAGNLGGAGVVNLNGTSTWSGTGNKDIYAVAANVRNAGTVTLTGTNVRSLPSGSGITNLSGASFNVAGDGAALVNFNAGSFVNNAGAFFRKTAGTGTSTVEWAFNNSGTVDVQTGTLALNGGGALGGSVTVAGGATLGFTAGAFTLQNGLSATGAGQVAVTTTNLPLAGGATATFGITVTQTGAAFGGNGDAASVLNVNATYNWSAGNLGGAGVVNLNGTSTWSGTGNKDVYAVAANVRNAGTITLTGTSVRSLPLGSGITNLSGGSFDLAGDGAALVNFNAGTFVNNAGAFLRKTAGTGTSTVEWAVNNAGTVDVRTGTLQLNVLSNLAANTLTEGTYRVMTNSTLTVTGATINTLAANTTVELNGTGSVFAAFNPVTTVNGTFAIRGGRTFTFAGPGLTVGATGTLTVGDTGSVLTVPDAIAFSNFAAGTLTNGTYEVLDNGTLDFGTRAITTNSATVILNGLSSTFVAINGFTTNSATGSFQVLGGRVFTLSNGFANAGSITVGAGSTLNLSGATNTGTVSNSGTANWTGTSDINFSGTGAWTNQNGSLLAVLNNQTISSGGGTPALANNGTIRKSLGTGTTTVAVPFTNSGSGIVDVQTGTLAFGGGGSSTGAFTVAANLQFTGGTFNLASGTGVSGAGTVAFTGGIVNVNVPYTVATLINGGTANFTGGPYSLPTLDLSGGVLGGNATVNVTGAFTWSGGAFEASSTLIARGGGSITGATPNNQLLNGGSLTLSGAASTWSGGTILIDNGSILTNALASVFTATGDNAMSRSSGTGTATFSNAGTFRKLIGTGTTTIGSNVAFINSGAVDVQTGTLVLSGGGSSTGSFIIGTILQFAGGTFNLTSGTGVSGTGTAAFTGGVTNVSVPYAVTTTVVGDGTVNFLGGPYSITTLTLSNGAVGGTAAVTVTGALNWSGGAFIGSNTITVDGSGLISGATANQYLNGGSLTLAAGTTTWSGGAILIDNGSVLTNTANSVFNATGNNAISRNSGAATASFVNAGIFRKRSGAGATTIGNNVTFTNSGTIDVQTGTLLLANSLANTGTIQTSSGSTVTGSVTSNTGGVVRGVGTFSGPLQFNSGSTLHPGLSPGILTATGAVSMSSGSTFSTELNGATAGNGYSQLLLSGSGASINLGNANLATTLGYMPNGSDVLTIIAGGPVTGTFANAPGGELFFVGTFGGPFYAVVTYSSNAVMLSGFTPIPEPAHLLAAAGAVGFAGWWRRRQKGNARAA
jgi:large repetitive protein